MRLVSHPAMGRIEGRQRGADGGVGGACGARVQALSRTLWHMTSTHPLSREGVRRDGEVTEIAGSKPGAGARGATTRWGGPCVLAVG